MFQHLTIGILLTLLPLPTFPPISNSQMNSLLQTVIYFAHHFTTTKAMAPPSDHLKQGLHRRRIKYTLSVRKWSSYSETTPGFPSASQGGGNSALHDLIPPGVVSEYELHFLTDSVVELIYSYHLEI